MKLIVILPFCMVLISCSNHACPNIKYANSTAHSDDYFLQKEALWTAIVKGFRGQVYYVGSDQDFDYFSVDRLRGIFRVARGKMALEERFSKTERKSQMVGFEGAKNIMGPDTIKERQLSRY